MQPYFRTAMPPCPAAISLIQNVSVKIAAMEQASSETLTTLSKHPNLSPHAATCRFIEHLEFLHANHARALNQHATALLEEFPLAKGGTSIPFMLSTISPPFSNAPEEILIFVYTQLNRLAANYTHLHTLGVAFENVRTVELSLNHLQAITPKIMECSQAIPVLTTEVTSLRFGQIAPDCAEVALASTQAAWRNETSFPDSRSDGAEA
jgi:hypothetical protein